MAARGRFSKTLIDLYVLNCLFRSGQLKQDRTLLNMTWIWFQDVSYAGDPNYSPKLAKIGPSPLSFRFQSQFHLENYHSSLYHTKPLEQISYTVQVPHTCRLHLGLSEAATRGKTAACQVIRYQLKLHGILIKHRGQTFIKGSLLPWADLQHSPSMPVLKSKQSEKRGI